MNYKIIHDEQKLQEFIDWLPELLPNEQYYIALLARKKYFNDGNLTNDKNQLKRVTATKDRIIQKIRQMECEVGSYLFKGEPIRQENLCIYITPNPRDLVKSGLVLLKEIADKTMKGDIYNPHSSALNAIQVTTSRKIYFDLDIDFKNIENFDEDFKKFKLEINQYIDENKLTYIRTNGGLHCLIRLEYLHVKYQKSWYQNISKMACDLYDVTMNADNIIPIPGCVQGIDFSPYFIDPPLAF
jgi:hypothetical protein